MGESEPRRVPGKAKRRRKGLGRRLLRYARRLAGGSTLVLGALMALFPEPPPLVSAAALAAFYGLMLSTGLWVGGLVTRNAGSRRQGLLAFDERGLTLECDGEVRRLAVAVRSGIVVPQAEGFEVLFELDGGDEISVLVEDEAAAEALLDMAGLNQEQRRTQVRWARVFNRLAAGFGGLMTGSMGFLWMIYLLGTLDLPRMIVSAATLSALILPYLLAGACSRLFAWRELVVGTDGISWKRYGQTRFVALREIESVEVEEGSLVLKRGDGTTLSIPIHADDPGLVEALSGRIHKALAGAGHSGGQLLLFARGERGFEEWVANVRDLLKKGRGFRDVAVNTQDALAVLSDPGADPESRIGAAVALEHTKEPALAAKVRVALESCASPKLRVALEDALAGEVEEMTVEAAQGELRER